MQKLLPTKNTMYNIFMTALLVVFVAYFAACFHYAAGSYIPAWARIGVWHMFTYKSIKHSELVAEIYRDNKWERVELHKHYPSMWDSGYRYQRGVFARNKTRLKTLAASLCIRVKRTQKVSIHSEYWPIILGKPHSTRITTKKVHRLRWNCEQKIYTPKGTLVL